MAVRRLAVSLGLAVGAASWVVFKPPTTLLNRIASGPVGKERDGPTADLVVATASASATLSYVDSLQKGTSSDDNSSSNSPAPRQLAYTLHVHGTSVHDNVSGSDVTIQEASVTVPVAEVGNHTTSTRNQSLHQ